MGKNGKITLILGDHLYAAMVEACKVSGRTISKEARARLADSLGIPEPDLTMGAPDPMLGLEVAWKKNRIEREAS